MVMVARAVRGGIVTLVQLDRSGSPGKQGGMYWVELMERIEFSVAAEVPLVMSHSTFSEPPQLSS